MSSVFLLFGLCAGLSCSLVVDTDGIDSGCGSGKKLCAGACVRIDDPSYGCKSEGCEPCRRDNGVPRCDENDCAYDTCLYGWGCSDCSEQILSNPAHCGGCEKACDPGETCSFGHCVPPPGAGGVSGN